MSRETIIPANVLHRMHSHNQRRESARKPLEPQLLKLGGRYPAYIRENPPQQITKPDSSKRKSTPLKKTLLDRLIRERSKTQKNFSKFHTARFVNGKKEGKYPILRKELMHKLRRLDDQIAKEATRLSLKAKQNFTSLKESIVINGIALPLNTSPGFDESLNKRIKQLRRILFLDEDQDKKSDDQAIAMDGLFALEGGKGFKFLAQLILGKENADSGFMKRTTASFANKNRALKIKDVLELIDSGKELIPIAQVKDDQGTVLIQISYLKGDKISIEIPGKYIKPADLEQVINRWLEAYDAESY